MIESRPVRGLARRIVSHYRGRMPAVLPSEWLAPAGAFRQPADARRRRARIPTRRADTAMPTQDGGIAKAPAAATPAAGVY
ncbi:MAG TPA: hypothetical protein VFX35_03230 [Solirubrobacterales bacterium]|nr:hypothetical protein [Solirubrobacterales bacterium]